MTHSIASANGTLYIVATPIGNQDDMTHRAINTLKTVDLIAAEDTRHSRPFLETLGIKTKLIAFHAHNESNASLGLIEALENGQNIALISDAGTPLIRDPGYPLVEKAHQAGIKVVPIPGACALIAALSAGGVPSDVFTFGGFLPATKAARQRALEAFKCLLAHTLVFYESTHRLPACLDDMQQVFGDDVTLVLAKELTKTFEAFVRGSVDDVKAWLLDDTARLKGEFVLMVLPRQAKENLTEDKRCLSILLKELPVKQAVKLTSALTGGNRNALYALAIADKT
ncbi:MAG: 16S rRNA (cytidine(1402)-2'-O)-methyltransferase [Gammaproteobacteria bacterium]|nr:16S rRNA (cytidine(1402)-2'-O)-methyltransferase [Gammaproteobacteria bacterium]MCH9716059.1 16S rRNA (cytidine(1402)-2'-O)-methyltransferase [Gammaproteobacteria bacterium]MCH9763085.1 16S rRNA (cytidine(1402)-2'-O)-methyltransferase [Gammaproteobacteria bacterium]